MMEWCTGRRELRERKSGIAQQHLETEPSLLKVGVLVVSVMPALHLLTTAQRANNGNKPNWPLPWEIDLYWLLPLHRPTKAISWVIQVWESLYGHG